MINTPSETCATCRFWCEYDPDQSSNFVNNGFTEVDAGIGRCRRFPPAARYQTDLNSNTGDEANCSYWATTWADDWCGEHAAPQTLDTAARSAAKRYAFDDEQRRLSRIATTGGA